MCRPNNYVGDHVISRLTHGRVRWRAWGYIDGRLPLVLSFCEKLVTRHFGTFATQSAQNRHADAVAACLLLGDERTWLGRGSGVLSSSPSLRGLLPSLGETRACPRRARRGRSSLVILVLSWKIYTVRQKDYRWGCSVGDVVAHLWLAAAELH